jgi:bifunctional UDP-N-acetylglucosamine pyrophosphorylase/glucosamine-1-phosphate N-acetyltransferase
VKAIILAAGRGVRLRPYTHITPKPLLKINGKRIIDYTLDILPQEIDEVIIVIGHLKWRMKWHLGKKHGHKKITYMVQKDKKGTAHALYLCKPLLKKKERFLVLFGDNIYAKKDLERCLKHKLSILAKEVNDPKDFGVLTFNKDRHLKEIIEKPNNPPTNLVNCGVFVLNRKIFNYRMEVISEKEFGLPQTIVKMAQDYPIKIIKALFWVPIGYSRDLKKAKEILKQTV